MNQGEFYVYSPDGAITGIDTIRVQGGRFAYEIPCEEEGTIVIVLPNYSEIPVFVEPVINPVVFVTDGVTLIEWLDTVPLLALGGPAVPDGTDALA